MKKRLMAFFLAVVTTVGSLPTAPVFAFEDEIVVEDAGEATISADEADLTIVSKNGADYSDADLAGETVQISANEVWSLSVNLAKADDSISADGIQFKVVVTGDATVAQFTSEKEMVSGNGAVYTEEDIEIKGLKNGKEAYTFTVVSKNEADADVAANWKTVKAATVTVKVVEPAEEPTGTPTPTPTEPTGTPTPTEPTATPTPSDSQSQNKPTTPSENKTTSENEADQEETVDPEVVAENQKDAEGFEAFTTFMDIDPDAQFQTIDMVVKQSFTNDALKGFTTADKKDKKIVTISKKGKISAKKVGKVVFTNGDKVLSVNVVKPIMPKKASVAGGDTIDVGIDGMMSTSLNVVFVSSDPAKASVSYDSAKRVAYVTGHVKGKVTLTAYVNGKTYKTKVTVTSDAPEAFLGYINKNTKKSFTVKKLKSWTILNDNGTGVTVKGKKFTAGATAGVVSVNGFDKKGNLLVSGNVIVQDLKLELAKGKTASVNGLDVNAGKELIVKKEGKGNKADTYEITIKLDQNEGAKGNVKKGYAKLAFVNYAQGQQVVFKSSKAANVYMNGNGVIVARKAYKKPVKLTGKVNGKKITIKVTVTE